MSLDASDADVVVGTVDIAEADIAFEAEDEAVSLEIAAEQGATLLRFYHSCLRVIS